MPTPTSGGCTIPACPATPSTAALVSDCGAMLAIELHGSAEAAQRCIEAVEVAVCSVSRGGVESVLTRPGATSHAGMDAEERASVGVEDGLIRMSVRIEDIDDIKLDLTQALYTM